MYALNIALSGPRSYDGDLKDYPFVNADEIRELGAIVKAVSVLWQTWALILIPTALVARLFCLT